MCPLKPRVLLNCGVECSGKISDVTLVDNAVQVVYFLFCLIVQSIIKRGLLKSPAIVTDLLSFLLDLFIFHLFILKFLRKAEVKPQQWF